MPLATVYVLKDDLKSLWDYRYPRSPECAGEPKKRVRVQPFAASFQQSAFSGQPFAMLGGQVPNLGHSPVKLSIARYL